MQGPQACCLLVFRSLCSRTVPPQEPALAFIFEFSAPADHRNQNGGYEALGLVTATGSDVELVDSKTGRSVNASSDDGFRRWPRTGDPGHER